MEESGEVWETNRTAEGADPAQAWAGLTGEAQPCRLVRNGGEE